MKAKRKFYPGARTMASFLEIERLNAEVAVLRDCNASLAKERDLEPVRRLAAVGSKRQAAH